MTVHEAAALLVEAFDCKALAYDGPEECEHVRVTISDSTVYLYAEPGGWGAITDMGASIVGADPIQVVVDYLISSRDETIVKLAELQDALSLIRNTSDTVEFGRCQRVTPSAPAEKPDPPERSP